MYYFYNFQVHHYVYTKCRDDVFFYQTLVEINQLKQSVN